MVNRYSVFDIFVLERWLDSMYLRLERSGTTLNSTTVREVAEELQRAVYELQAQRKQSGSV